MHGYIRCQRCGWSRTYARFSVARIPSYCPGCGAGVVRERNPSADSPGLQPWRAIAKRLTSDAGRR